MEILYGWLGWSNFKILSFRKAHMVRKDPNFWYLMKKPSCQKSVQKKCKSAGALSLKRFRFSKWSLLYHVLVWTMLSDSAAADLDFFCTLFSHDDFFIKYQKFWSFLTIWAFPKLKILKFDHPSYLYKIATLKYRNFR